MWWDTEWSQTSGYVGLISKMVRELKLQMNIHKNIWVFKQRDSFLISSTPEWQQRHASHNGGASKASCRGGWAGLAGYINLKAASYFRWQELKGWLWRIQWWGLHLLFTNAMYTEDVQVSLEQGKRRSALFYPYTTVCCHTGFTTQEDEVD